MYKDSDRNYWMTAEEAKEYGMIDTVLVRKNERMTSNAQDGRQE